MTTWFSYKFGEYRYWMVWKLLFALWIIYALYHCAVTFFYVWNYGPRLYREPATIDNIVADVWKVAWYLMTIGIFFSQRLFAGALLVCLCTGYSQGFARAYVNYQDDSVTMTNWMAVIILIVAIQFFGLIFLRWCYVAKRPKLDEVFQ